MDASRRGLVQPFLSDRFDVVGDIHGEIDALRALLDRLGVDVARARVDRPLVFVGDLIDRGPDSVAVCETVAHLVRSGVAQCILGNHELNALLGLEKQGNGWLIPRLLRSGMGSAAADSWHSPTGRAPFVSRIASESERCWILDFFRTLPVALESETVRVVHAAWSPTAILDAKRAQSLERFLNPLPRPLTQVDLRGAPTPAALRDPSRPVKFHPGVAAQQLAEQNGHSAHLLTSGFEESIGPDEEPRFIGGRWRFLKRSPWWLKDEDPRAVIFGHYWRKRAGGPSEKESDGFGGLPAEDWSGSFRQAFCVDFSVGYRVKARHLNRALGEEGGLGALRWPEKILFFDDRTEELQTR